MASRGISIDNYRPAKRRALVENDPVKRIIDSDTLPSDLKEQFRAGDLRRYVVSRTTELLRQLKARARPPLLRNDTAEGRAAVALEHVLLTSENVNIKPIPLVVLGSQHGLKKKPLEELQRTLSHYIADIESKKPQTRGSNASRQIQNRSSAAGIGGTEVVRRSHNIGRPEIIRYLSIRLGSLVHDTEGSARRAEILFDNIKKHMEQSPHRSAQLSDLRRHQAAYESACFYVSVKESEGGAIRKNPKQNVTNTAESGSDGEDEERNITIADVAAAAKLTKKTLKDILRAVEKMSEEFKSQATQSLPWQEQQKGRKEDKGKSKKQRRASDAPSESLASTQLPLQRDTADAEDVKHVAQRSMEETARPSNRAYVPTAKFLEWKKKILSDAVGRVRKKSMGEQLSDQDALDRAANDVIHRRSH